MKTTSISLLGAAGLCCLGGASAATYFADTLTSDAGNFATGTGTGAVTFGAGGATFGGSGDGGRRYLHTLDTSYFSAPLTATLTFSLPAGATGASVLFFGIGTGDVGTFYNQPDQNLAGHTGAWVGWDPRDLGGKSGRIEAVTMVNGASTNFLGAGETPFAGTVGYGPGSGLNTAVMTWDPATRQIQWTLDIASNGVGVDETVTTTLSQTLVDNWNGTTAGNPSSIFFGGNNGIVVTNFSVTVPEPGIMALAAAGLLLPWRRRR